MISVDFMQLFLPWTLWPCSNSPSTLEKLFFQLLERLLVNGSPLLAFWGLDQRNSAVGHAQANSQVIAQGGVESPAPLTNSGQVDALSQLQSFHQVPPLKTFTA